MNLSYPVFVIVFLILFGLVALFYYKVLLKKNPTPQPSTPLEDLKSQTPILELSAFSVGIVESVMSYSGPGHISFYDKGFIAKTIGKEQQMAYADIDHVSNQGIVVQFYFKTSNPRRIFVETKGQKLDQITDFLSKKDIKIDHM